MAFVSRQAKTLFAEFARTYLAAKLENPTFRPATKRLFRNQVVRHLIPAFGARALDEISNAAWLAWTQEESKKPKGITVFFNARKVLLEVLRAAHEAGSLPKLPRLDNPDEPRDVGRVLQPREVMAILRRVRSKQFRFFFFTFWKMGCRPQEICRWEWSMIKWNEPGHTWIEIPARISKNNRSRKIAICPAVSRRLWKQRHAAESSPFVFPSNDGPELRYSSPWRSAAKRAGINAVPYDLRRTFITELMAAGKDIEWIARALDTSPQMIRKVYLKDHIDSMESLFL